MEIELFVLPLSQSAYGMQRMYKQSRTERMLEGNFQRVDRNLDSV